MFWGRRIGELWIVAILWTSEWCECEVESCKRDRLISGCSCNISKICGAKWEWSISLKLKRMCLFSWFRYMYWMKWKLKLYYHVFSMCIASGFHYCIIHRFSMNDRDVESMLLWLVVQTTWEMLSSLVARRDKRVQKFRNLRIQTKLETEFFND